VSEFLFGTRSSPDSIGATHRAFTFYPENPISSIPDSEYLFVSTGASGFDSRNVNANNEAKNIWIEWTHH